MNVVLVSFFFLGAKVQSSRVGGAGSNWWDQLREVSKADVGEQR